MQTRCLLLRGGVEIVVVVFVVVAVQRAEVTRHEDLDQLGVVHLARGLTQAVRSDQPGAEEAVVLRQAFLGVSAACSPCATSTEHGA